MVNSSRPKDQDLFNRINRAIAVQFLIFSNGQTSYRVEKISGLWRIFSTGCKKFLLFFSKSSFTKISCPPVSCKMSDPICPLSCKMSDPICPLSCNSSNLCRQKVLSASIDLPTSIVENEWSVYICTVTLAHFNVFTSRLEASNTTCIK